MAAAVKNIFPFALMMKEQLERLIAQSRITVEAFRGAGPQVAVKA